MHIPDGYLSPQTCAAAFVVMLPIWWIAGKKIAKNLARRTIPKMAMGASFAFIIMLFNIPIPNGTTAHALGATLLAITLGPWAACIALSIAIFIQALLFGDGGILALGANCFNMAFVAPFAGYAIYKIILHVKNNIPLAAGIGAYVGINLAALAAAIELGIQPLLFHTQTHAALYFPYNLHLTIPAMLLAHSTLAGIAEAAVTALTIAYLHRLDEDHVLHCNLAE